MIKEKYFTDKSINKKALEMIETLEKKVRLKEKYFFFEKSALLVLDMQKYFTEQSSHAFIPAADSVIRNINMLLDLYYKKNLTVIFTKHINNENDSGNMKTWWKDLITENNSLSKITKKLDVSGGTIIKKSQYDAFYKTDLNDILNNKNIKQLVITGVMTHLCCETTARSAFIKGYDVFFAIDGTATYNEDFHMSSMLNLAHGFVVPVMVKSILKK